MSGFLTSAQDAAQMGLTSLGSAFGASGVELTPYASGIALALGLYVLSVTFSGGKNWSKVKDTLVLATESSLTLLPALSVLALESPSWTAYATTGVGATLLSYGIAATLPAAKENNANVESKWQMAGANLAYGLGVLGGSFFVGSVIAASKTFY